ncbi:MAG: hypothetical protein HS111_16030 [Kofleriaceae bacterium]|nr:hypothetical protein [Kofleriaceae bacterium]
MAQPPMYPAGPGYPPGPGRLALPPERSPGVPKIVPIVVSIGCAIGTFSGLFFGLGTGADDAIAEEAKLDGVGSAGTAGGKEPGAGTASGSAPDTGSGSASGAARRAAPICAGAGSRRGQRR